MRTYVCTYVRPSTESLFDFNEIWHAGRGRWVMHDGMQYDPIQGTGHKPLKIGNHTSYLKWELATDRWFLNYGTMSKFDQARFLIFGLVFLSRDFELAETSVAKSRPSIPYGTNLLFWWLSWTCAQQFGVLSHSYDESFIWCRFMNWFCLTCVLSLYSVLSVWSFFTANYFGFWVS